MKIAFNIPAVMAGIYTSFLRLDGLLRQQGHQVIGVFAGPDIPAKDLSNSEPELVTIGDRSDSFEKAARAYVDWIEANEIDVVVPNNSKLALSVVPHLPSTVHVVNICRQMTSSLYSKVMANQQCLSRMVVISPRQRRDLAQRYGFPPARMQLIPSSIDVDRFAEARDRQPLVDNQIKLIFIGRLDEEAKGISLLPKVVRRLRDAGVPCSLTVVGDGADRERLEQQIARRGVGDAVHMLGGADREQIPSVLGEHDALLFPSRFEGCPNVLLEAMAAGRIPIATRIAEVTDWIVQHGRSGMICPPNDDRAMSSALIDLYRNPEKGRALASDAVRRVAGAFHPTREADAWQALLQELAQNSPSRPEPAPWSRFEPVGRKRIRWGRYVPGPLKGAIRGWVEKVKPT